MIPFWRKIVLLGLVLAPLWAAGGAASAQSPSAATAAAAEKAYNDGDFATALKDYGELLKDSPADPALLYDLGTVYAKQGDRGRSAWRYAQALAIAPRDPSLIHNLRIVAPGFEQDLSVTPIPPLNALFWRLTGNEWTGLAAGTAFLGLILLALGQWISPVRAAQSLVRKGGIVFLAIALFAWPPALLRYHQEHLQWRGVVIAEGTAAHTEPTATSFENFTLPAGKIVRILDKARAGWLKIGFAGDRIGFVERDKVEFL